MDVKWELFIVGEELMAFGGGGGGGVCVCVCVRGGVDCRMW